MWSAAWTAIADLAALSRAVGLQLHSSFHLPRRLSHLIPPWLSSALQAWAEVSSCHFDEKETKV